MTTEQAEKEVREKLGWWIQADYLNFADGTYRTATQQEIDAYNLLVSQIMVADCLAEVLRKAKRSHVTCEDSWYNCPASEEGSAQYGDDETECLCGADEINAKIDKALAIYEKAKSHSGPPKATSYSDNLEP